MSAAAWLIFLAFGAAASWQDYRARRVSNRLIAAGLWATLACYAVLALGTALGARGWSLGPLGRYYLPPDFYEKAALHAVLGLASAVALWYLRVWPAGDAKLFLVCAPLLALIDPNLRGFPQFLVVAMLSNIFVAAALFVLLRVLGEWLGLLADLRRREGRARVIAAVSRAARRARDERPRLHRYAVFAWNTFALFLLCRLTQPLLGARGGGVWGALAVYAALYVVWDRIRDQFLRWDLAGLSFFAVSCVLLPWGLWRRWDILAPLAGGGRLAFGFWLFLPAARMVFDYYLRATTTVPLESATLAEGMVLSEESWRTLSGAYDGSASEPPARYSDGLSGEDVASIRERLGAKGFTVLVHSPRPFAFWVFVGCLWTALSRREIAEWLIRLF